VILAGSCRDGASEISSDLRIMKHEEHGTGWATAHPIHTESDENCKVSTRPSSVFGLGHDLSFTVSAGPWLGPTSTVQYLFCTHGDRPLMANRRTVSGQDCGLANRCVKTHSRPKPSTLATLARSASRRCRRLTVLVICVPGIIIIIIIAIHR